MLLSNAAPLFYYSFLKIERTGLGDKEIPEANKISVHRHNNCKKSGLLIEMYSCGTNGKWEIYDGVAESKITYEKECSVYFTDPDNRAGIFSVLDSMPEMSFAQTGGTEYNFFLNFYRNYGAEVFSINRDSVNGFLISSAPLCGSDEVTCNGFPVWETIRGIIGEYYSRIYRWKNDGPQAFRDNTDIWDKVALLGYLEGLCDERAAKAYNWLKHGNALMFKVMMESMVSVLGTYYLMYRVICDRGLE